MIEDYGFTDGLIYGPEKVIAIASSASAEENDIDHAFICHFKDGSWNYWYEEISIIKVCVYDGKNGLTLVEMGTDGDIVVRDSVGYRLEVLSETERPNRLRPLSDIRQVGGYLYVTGMRRQVFRRAISDSVWRKSDEGAFVTSQSREVAGFLSIDGFSEDDIYAVGYNGQIWRFNGKMWHEVSSPTNLRLESVRCIGNKVIAVGDEGVIISGRGDIWSVVEQNIFDEVFTDVECCFGRTFIATELGMLFSLEGGELLPQELDVTGEITTGQLHSNGDYLLSVGERNLLVFNGISWKSLPLPDLHEP